MSPADRRWLIWPAVALLLGACAAFDRDPAHTRSPAERQAEARALERFSVSGKLGIWSEAQALSSRFDWSQDGVASRVVLTAPFGIGQWTLTASPDTGARLQRGNGVPVQDASMDALVQRALRLDNPIPVSELPNWLRGLASPAQTPRHDQYGRLESLTHRTVAGERWQVEFLRHVRLDAIEVPALITATGRANSAGGEPTHYRLRVVLDDWRRLEPEVSAQPEHDAGPTAPADSPGRLKIPGR